MDGRLRANQPLFRAPGRVSLGLSVDCGEIWAGARRAEQRRAEFGLEGQPRPAPPRPGPSPGFALLVNGAVVRGCGVRSTSSSHNRSRHAPSDQRLPRGRAWGEAAPHTASEFECGTSWTPPPGHPPPSGRGEGAARPPRTARPLPNPSQLDQEDAEAKRTPRARTPRRRWTAPPASGRAARPRPPRPIRASPGPGAAWAGLSRRPWRRRTSRRTKKTHTLERRSQNLP